MFHVSAAWLSSLLMYFPYSWNAGKCSCLYQGRHLEVRVELRRCNLEDQCCDNYEHCVACCQDPKHAPADLSSAYRGHDRYAARVGCLELLLLEIGC